MTGKDLINVRITNRFHINYKFSKGELIFAFFYIRISAFIAVSGLIYWALQIATRGL